MQHQPSTTAVQSQTMFLMQCISALVIYCETFAITLITEYYQDIIDTCNVINMIEKNDEIEI